MVSWYTLSEFSPSEPVGASKFWVASTALMSEGTSPYWAMRSGFIQIRIL